MKSKILLLAVLVFVLQSCCPDCKTCNTCPHEETKEVCDELSAVSLIPDSIAFKYVEEAWKDSLCIRNAIKDGMAAFFKTEDVLNLIESTKDANPYNGLLFVPAVEKVDSKENLYFAFKKTSVCPGDPNGYRPITVSDNFKRSSVNVPAARRGSVQIPELTAKAFLDSLKIATGITPTLTSVNSKQLLKDNFNYKLSYSDSANYADFGYGFIQKDYFERFLNQNNPANANIYGYWVVLGLNKKNSTEYVRMVFFPTNSSGRILKGSYCLEKSWPPIDPSKK